MQPDAVIRGDQDTKGTLLIERGAKLIAEGSVSQPIVFTSNKAVGGRANGDWGGGRLFLATSGRNEKIFSTIQRPSKFYIKLFLWV